MAESKTMAGLLRLLEDRAKEVEALGSALIAGRPQRVAGAFAALLTALGTQSPLLASWANEVVQKAFIPPATRRLLNEIARYDELDAREAFIRDLSERLALVLAQGLLQTVDASGERAAEVQQALGGLRDDFAEFRREFAQALPPTFEALCVDELWVEGGVGISVGGETRVRMAVKSARVTGGIGVKFE